MQTLKSVSLQIKGSFWDSQIYSGEMILFSCDGSLLRFHWSSAIDALAADFADAPTGLRIAFSESDLLYHPKVRKLLQDPQIQTPIVSQLRALGERRYEISLAKVFGLNKITVGSPFNFAPVDTEIYYNRLYAGDETGLHSVDRNDRSTRSAEKHHDGRIFQIKASDSVTAVATATGNDGLLEFSVLRDREEPDVLSKAIQLTPRACIACDWAFQSVVGWGSDSSFFVNYFDTPKTREGRAGGRVLDRVVDGSSAFETKSRGRSYIWGAREKIYNLDSSGIEVSDYVHHPSKRERADAKAVQAGPRFDHRGKISTGSIDLEAFVAAGTAPFGAVIELDDEIVVLRSDGVIDRFPGEALHWRIFPRSTHYSNQLHIIYEDHMVVVSFIHDYFVNQGSKLAGFSKGKKFSGDFDDA